MSSVAVPNQDCVSVRRARPADLDSIVDLRLEFERITRNSGSIDEGRRFELRSMLGRDLRSGRLIAWMAEVDGRTVGQAALRIKAAAGFSPARSGDIEGELVNVFVLPEFRRRGTGAALVRAAINEGRGLGLDRITLQPTDESRRMYERSGFAGSRRRMILVFSRCAGL